MKADLRISIKDNQNGFTRLEVVVLVAALFILAFLAVVALANSLHKARRISCVSNLKQIGLAFRIFPTDNKGRFPMQMPTNQGGTFEYVMTGEVFRHYQVMSNELGTPMVVRCPEDRRTMSTYFFELTNNSQVSYFVGVDAVETEPQTLLSGDRHMTGLTASSNQIFILYATNKPGWSKELHWGNGNVVLANGSVQQASSNSLRSLTREMKTPQRLAVP
jgi:type II secretory pathway pseudopilin PulG